jgi:hypothetical protein
LSRQKVDPDGSRVCNIADELGSRAILQHWRDTMASAGDSAASSPVTRSDAARHVR